MPPRGMNSRTLIDLVVTGGVVGPTNLAPCAADGRDLVLDDRVDARSPARRRLKSVEDRRDRARGRQRLGASTITQQD